MMWDEHHLNVLSYARMTTSRRVSCGGLEHVAAPTNPIVRFASARMPCVYARAAIGEPRVDAASSIGGKPSLGSLWHLLSSLGGASGAGSLG
jgi:hypothetical protein